MLTIFAIVLFNARRSYDVECLVTALVTKLHSCCTTVKKSFKTVEKVQNIRLEPCQGWILQRSLSRNWTFAQAAIWRGRLDSKATENNERLLRRPRPVAVNYVFTTDSLEMEVVSAVTKGLDIAGKLSIQVVATYYICTLSSVG